MINTSKNIKETIDYLVADVDPYLNKDFIYQEQYFISEDHNFTFNNIEKHLNDLYERTRMLQDVISYAKTFVKESVRTISAECVSILDTIEDSVDSLKNKAYISIEVPFAEGNGAYKDRSGVTLPKASVQNGALTLSYETKKEIAINSITKTKGVVAYRSNLEDLKKDIAYRTFYMLDAPVKDGLIEEITVEFKQEEPINYVSIIPSNCEVISVEYVNSSGTVDHIQNYKNLVHSLRKVKRIVFTLRCSSYDTKTYYIDETRLKSNFWDKVQEDLYNQSIGLSGTLSAADLDELAGLNQFLEDYDKYIAQVEDWIKRRQEVVNKNIANGHSDSMPTVDVVVPPESLLSKRVQKDDEEIKEIVNSITDTNTNNETNPLNFLPTVEYQHYEQKGEALDIYGNEIVDKYISEKYFEAGPNYRDIRNGVSVLSPKLYYRKER